GTEPRDGLQSQRLRRDALGSATAEQGERDLPPARPRRADGAHATVSRVVQRAPPPAAMTRLATGVREDERVALPPQVDWVALRSAPPPWPGAPGPPQSQKRAPAGEMRGAERQRSPPLNPGRKALMSGDHGGVPGASEPEPLARAGAQ